MDVEANQEVTPAAPRPTEPPGGTGWTDERTAWLVMRHADGASGGVIADELKLPTRNAVIGKIHRLGLAPHGKQRAAPRQYKPRLQRARLQPSTSMLLVAPSTQPEGPDLAESLQDIADALQDEAPGERTETACDLRGLNETTCRWPHGDPQEAGFFFCGAKPFTGTPYCGPHARMAYQPSRARL